jgi:hypothetical protein
MDTDDVNTARKVWRWNLNGLGYSNTGYNGTYATAITMDGQIVGERLVGGSVSAEKLSVEYTTQVTKEIADAEKTARSDAEDYTDAKLKDYYTISQITTAIKNTADSVLLSAKETAVEYVDGRLQNYSTSADIKVTTDAITSEVSKKLNSSDFTTKLTQNYKYVRIAWNSCTKYIQFEGAALNVYDNSEQLLMSLTYTGARYYYQGTSIGRIGTNSWSSDTSYRGLVFDLEYDASYMCWAAKDSSSATSYTTKLIYHHKNTKDKQGLHFACNTYADGNLYLTDDYRFLVWSSGGCGFNGKMTWCNKANSNAVVIDGVNKQFAIYNNVDIDFYAALDMHNYSINNQSDARMKKNIADTQVEALKMLNAIDLKEFDWVQTGGHENIGIIAQQLALFAPELVNEEADGHLSIKTTKFIFYLIKAVQELSKGLGYEKVAWEDPYTLLEKKSFCALLSAEIATDEEAVKEPIQIPIRKG